MLCSVCKKKPATVHVTTVLGDNLHKVDLCELCARTKGVTEANFALADPSLYDVSVSEESGPEGGWQAIMIAPKKINPPNRLQ